MYVCSAEVSANFSLATMAFYSLYVHEIKRLFFHMIRRAKVNLLMRHMLLLEENMPHPPSAFRDPLSIRIDIPQIYYHLLACLTFHLAAVLDLNIDPVHQLKI